MSHSDKRRKKIGEHMRKAREACLQSQDQVAEAMGWSKAKLQHYEAGRHLPDLLETIRLATHYGISLDALVLNIGTLSIDVAEKLNLQNCKPWTDGTGRDVYGAKMRILYRRLGETDFGALR